MERFEPMVAIDVDTKQAALKLFDELANDTDHTPIVKIGMELYYAFGPGIVREAKQRGFKIFLDLKLYDIPNTVKRAMTAIGKMGVSFVTTHAAGGSEMLQAAKTGLAEGAKAAGCPMPKLLAITELTSIDDRILHEEQHVDFSLIEAVQNYAQLRKKTVWTGSSAQLKKSRRFAKLPVPIFCALPQGFGQICRFMMIKNGSLRHSRLASWAAMGSWLAGRSRWQKIQSVPTR